ncbi:MAG: helix-turn-helix domain-containing protein [Clostridia bacterium]|nr:helix-turn-helix domain-containing protein [Clostridia bacterium]
MEKDVVKFASEIVENGGAEFSVFSEKGELIFGKPLKKVPENGIAHLKRDEKSGVTFFEFKYKNKGYIGAVSGEEKYCSSVAYFVCELAERSFGKDSSLSREDFFKSALFGEAGYYKIKKYAKKFGVEDKTACVMLIRITSGNVGDVEEAVKNYSGSEKDFVSAIDENVVAFVKFDDEASAEYRSVTEYAEYLNTFISEETGAVCGISIGGKVKGISDLGESFSQAIATDRMAEVYDKKCGVHSYKEFISIKILEDIPKHKVTEYLGTWLDASAKEIFDDKEMTATAEAFMDNSLNVSETSRKMYLHRNTLNYRLDKIERGTGLDIRKVSDAMTFRIISVLLRSLR